MPEDKKNEVPKLSPTQAALQNYIGKIGAEHSTNAFAEATDRNQAEFKPIGTVIIPFSAETLPEDFEETFQKNLTMLQFQTTTRLQLVGSPKVGFISTKNRIRVTFTSEKVTIQLGYNSELTPTEAAKIGVAAIKTMVRNPSLKNISLGEFSDDLLLQSTVALIHKHGFSIEKNSEEKKENKFDSNPSESMESTISSVPIEPTEPEPIKPKEEKKSEPLHFFTMPKKSAKKAKEAKEKT